MDSEAATAEAWTGPRARTTVPSATPSAGPPKPHPASGTLDGTPRGGLGSPAAPTPGAGVQPRTAGPAAFPVNPCVTPWTGRPRRGQPSWEEAESPHRPLATLSRAESAALSGERLEDETEARLAGIGQLSAASHAIHQAASLHDAVATRMRGVLARTECPSAARHPARVVRGRPAAASATLALLRNPTTVRQAVIASILLQPPKAFRSIDPRPARSLRAALPRRSYKSGTTPADGRATMAVP